MRGADVLEVAVAKNLSSTTAIAKDLTGVADGRKVRRKLARLEQVGLLEVISGVVVVTQRGREVDAILAQITAARGGTFAPWGQSGLTIAERLALQA